MRIYIDYNAETADGRFFARLARLDERVELGRVVQTHDDDGNGLVMTVDEIDEDNRLVYLRPDWSTWVDGDSPRMEITAGAIGLGRVPCLRQFPYREAAFLHVSSTTVHLSHLATRAQTEETVRPIPVRPRLSALA
jgi:hypothetical protein